MIFALLFTRNASARFQNSTDSLSTESNKVLIKGLKIQYGSSLNFHLKDKPSNDPNIPDRFESLEERPSVASFFMLGMVQL